MWSFKRMDSGLGKSFISDVDTTRTSGENFLSSFKSKDKFHKSLATSKSSPNLSNEVDGKVKRCNSPVLFKNASTEFINSPPLMNPHKALIDLYNKYSSNKGDAFRRSFSLRTRKMKTITDIYKYCNEENTFNIKLRKSSRGLGLCIYGGRDVLKKDPFHQLIRIWNLHPLQPALECGKLALGDVILEVNGISMLGLTKAEAVEILKNAPIDVELRVFRPSKYLLPSFPEYQESMCSDNVSSHSADKNLSCCGNTLCNGKSGEIKITLMKRDGCLGFSVLRVDNIQDSSGGIFVKALTREHAIADGRVQPGDRILQVNGIDISGFSHFDAITCLRSTPEKVTLTLCRNCSGSRFCQKHSQRMIQTFNVTLEKMPNENIGFSVWNSTYGDRDTPSHILPCAAEVKFVTSGSLADENGIRVGDRIIEVNGDNLIGKTADEVIDIFRKTNGVIRMVFCRLK